jgi:NitT/TauT family transport system substrate-binding protein
MAKFRVQSHGRLQEWVAEEHGYFRAEGLDYEFLVRRAEGWSASVQDTNAAPPEVVRGAFESFEAGRACEVSSACHWATNMAASGSHGRMYGKAYSVTPSGIYVPPESPVRRPEDLAGVEIAVGYHSGSHFSSLQALEPFLAPEQVKLRFTGLPLDRLTALLDRTVPAGAVFGVPLYVLEQQGFRKVVDTTFMIGFIVEGGATEDDVERYFRALQRAQRDIDLEPERYKHYLLRELPERFHALMNVRACGPGERLVFAPYTLEMFEQTHRWMERLQLFPADQAGSGSYQQSVLV